MLRPANNTLGTLVLVGALTVTAEPTARKLHQHPVGLDVVLLDKFYKDTHVHSTGLDHLGEDEALRGSLLRHTRGKRGGWLAGIAWRNRGCETHLLNIGKG